MSKAFKKFTEENLNQLAREHTNSFLFGLISEYAKELAEARKREEESKNKIIELNEILKLLNTILRHDVLNDLTVIKVNFDLYLRKKHDKSIAYIQNAIRRSSEKIAKMGELESAIFTGNPLRAYSVYEVIMDVVKGFPNVKFKIKGQAVVMADEAFYSVIENIITNAQIHGHTKRIDIKISKKDKNALIKIADYGKGIHDKIKVKLFNEKFKYSQTGHTGLGLYITRRTIERYGGSVSVKNNNPKGTVFELLLPAIEK